MRPGSVRRPPEEVSDAEGQGDAVAGSRGPMQGEAACSRARSADHGSIPGSACIMVLGVTSVMPAVVGTCGERPVDVTPLWTWLWFLGVCGVAAGISGLVCAAVDLIERSERDSRIG